MIYEADLNDVKNLKTKSFEFALCRFIFEVRKKTQNGEYPDKMLYQLACALQNYLHKNDIN